MHLGRVALDLAPGSSTVMGDPEFKRIIDPIPYSAGSNRLPPLMLISFVAATCRWSALRGYYSDDSHRVEDLR